jgi:ribosome maturation factor RimP
MSKTSDRDSLMRLLAPVVEQAGVDLEDVAITPAGKRRLLRVVVDQDGGVGLDTVARVSSAVSAVLDAADAMGRAPYVLEVTSPGVDRPLTQPRHWRRAQARLVDATLADGSLVTGRIIAGTQDGVLLDIDGTQRLMPWSELVRGRVQVEFNRAEDR